MLSQTQVKGQGEMHFSGIFPWLPTVCPAEPAFQRSVVEAYLFQAMLTAVVINCWIQYIQVISQCRMCLIRMHGLQNMVYTLC